VIDYYKFLGLIHEPDWVEYTNQFDESSFEVYSTRALIEVTEEESRVESRDI
jgi:hypothetical protein